MGRGSISLLIPGMEYEKIQNSKENVANSVFQGKNKQFQLASNTADIHRPAVHAIETHGYSVSYSS